MIEINQIWRNLISQQQIRVIALDEEYRAIYVDKNDNRWAISAYTLSVGWKLVGHYDASEYPVNSKKLVAN